MADKMADFSRWLPSNVKKLHEYNRITVLNMCTKFQVCSLSSFSIIQYYSVMSLCQQEEDETTLTP